MALKLSHIIQYRTIGVSQTPLVPILTSLSVSITHDLEPPGDVWFWRLIRAVEEAPTKPIVLHYILYRTSFAHFQLATNLIYHYLINILV